MQVSLWEKESFFAPQDVIIAGAGLMGLWTAYELKKADPKLRITILEKNITPLGASTRNAGFACYGSPSELLYDLEQNGEAQMLSVVEMRYKGIEKIRTIFQGKDIGWDHCGGYEVFDDNTTLHKVTEQLGYLNALLARSFNRQVTFKWSNEKMQQMGMSGFAAMAENEDEAALHSGKLVQALMQLVISSGVNILTGMPIHSWELTGNGIKVHTDQIQFSTERLILSTNAFTKGICGGSTITPGRGQVIVTKPIADLKLKGTFHYDEGFYYFRNVGNRILLGGARNSDIATETTTELSTTANIRSILLQFLQDHLYTNAEIEMEWSGIMGFTENKQPLIHSIADNIISVTACNGMGVALSPIFAEKVAGTIL